MTDTKKYIVTKKHTFDHKVGDIIDLTDKQALNLANKINLAPVKKEIKKSKKGKS